MEDETTRDEPVRFVEVDPVAFLAALRPVLSSLTEEERLLGKVTEDGDIVWSGCPRWLFTHPRSWPTADGIADEAVGADGATADERKGG
jgi:hypothetical protein